MFATTTYKQRFTEQECNAFNGSRKRIARWRVCLTWFTLDLRVTWSPSLNWEKKKKKKKKRIFRTQAFLPFVSVNLFSRVARQNEERRELEEEKRYKRSLESRFVS